VKIRKVSYARTVNTVATAPTTRRRGSALEAAIFAAVWAELADHGYMGLTVAGVAVRAGTSKPVLYRRWPNRARLVYAALANRHRTIKSPDTGSLRGDLLALMTAVGEQAATVTPDAIWGLLAESADDHAFVATIQEELVDLIPERLAATVVARAEDRGELAPRQRSARELTLPFDLMRNEFFTRGRVDAKAIDAILDEIALPLLRRR
jgi:AcrR family transcriptional regulator